MQPILTVESYVELYGQPERPVPGEGGYLNELALCEGRSMPVDNEEVQKQRS